MPTERCVCLSTILARSLFDHRIFQVLGKQSLTSIKGAINELMYIAEQGQVQLNEEYVID